MSDRLALAHAPEDFGMSRDKAEHVATTVYDAIRGEVARKADLLELDTSARHRVSITLRRAGEQVRHRGGGLQLGPAETA